MAEEGSPLVGNRPLIIAVGVVLLGALLFFAWSFRGCLPAPGAPRDSGYVNIYTNLDLKDSAAVIARLKELKIPYEVRQNGTAIAVPKEKQDDARLGLAEKSLPVGGRVGWEIFDETRMGATDFDRRIQLIRAISGELSRTIKRIEGVDDAHVQIVLPETRLFEVTRAPVTAAVLIKLQPGVKLRPEQVNGIIRLVANSVENLQTENVTIVDDSGNILTARPVLLPSAPERGTAREGLEPPSDQEIVKKEDLEEKEEPIREARSIFSFFRRPAREEPIPLPESEKVEEKPLELTQEQSALLKMRAKEEYERQLTAKAQEIINSFYPRDAAVVRVSVDFGEPIKGTKQTQLRIRSDAGFIIAPIQKITVICLVDDDIKLTPKLKDSTFKMIATAVSYDRNRGDRIYLKKVPFHHHADIKPIEPEEEEPLAVAPILPDIWPQVERYRAQLIWGGGGLLFLILAAIAGRAMARRRKKRMLKREEPVEDRSAPSESEATDTVKTIKEMAKDNPERIANLLKKWLTEEAQ